MSTLVRLGARVQPQVPLQMITDFRLKIATLVTAAVDLLLARGALVVPLPVPADNQCNAH